MWRGRSSSVPMFVFFTCLSFVIVLLSRQYLSSDALTYEQRDIKTFKLFEMMFYAINRTAEYGRELSSVGLNTNPRPKIAVLGLTHKELGLYGDNHDCPYSCYWESQTQENQPDTKGADLVIFKGWRYCWKGNFIETRLNYQTPYISESAPDGCSAFSSPLSYDWPISRPPGQVWLYLLQNESPARSHSGPNQRFTGSQFNYTITYKKESTVQSGFRHKYGFWPVTTVSPRNRLKNYAAEKTKAIHWYVSNCHNTQIDRVGFANKLSRHIPIDVFGKCSGKSDGCESRDAACVTKVRSTYMFYLAFENSLCQDYITEKVWNCFLHETIPIIMGGLSKEDYGLAQVPANSYIDIDDFNSIQELADYLKYLMSNQTAYNEYHAWRSYLTFPRLKVESKEDLLEILRSAHRRVACEACRLATSKPPSVINLTTFWNEKTDCRNLSYT